MPEGSFQDKTEPATPKRREDARKKGEVAKSRELASVAVLMAGVAYLFFAGKSIFLDLGGVMTQAFMAIPSFNDSDFNLMTLLAQNIEIFLKLVFPLMLMLVVVAILSNILQTGFIWSVEPLAPKVSKISPASGVKKIFSKRSLVELGKSIAKIFIVAWAAYSTLRNDFSHLIPLIYQDKGQIIIMMSQIAMKVIIRCCWVIAILAFLDFLYQKWEFGQKLKMTKQEVKDEFKQTEGDPLVKSRIRSLQRDMARRRMMEMMERRRAEQEAAARDPWGTAGGRREEAVVFVMNADGVLSQRHVVTGVRDWEFTEVLEGLAPGEEAVMLPSTSLLRSQDDLRARFAGRSMIPGMGGGGRGMGRPH